MYMVSRKHTEEITIPTTHARRVCPALCSVKLWQRLCPLGVFRHSGKHQCVLHGHKLLGCFVTTLFLSLLPSVDFIRDLPLLFPCLLHFLLFLSAAAPLFKSAESVLAFWTVICSSLQSISNPQEHDDGHSSRKARSVRSSTRRPNLDAVWSRREWESAHRT